MKFGKKFLLVLLVRGERWEMNTMWCEAVYNWDQGPHILSTELIVTWLPFGSDGSMWLRKRVISFSGRLVQIAHWTAEQTCTFVPSFVGLHVARSNWAESQASAAKRMRTVLFWAITQRVVVIPYRRFGTINRPPSYLHQGPKGCPYTAVRNSHYSRRNTSE